MEAARQQKSEAEHRAAKLTALVGRIAKDFRHLSPASIAEKLEDAPQEWWKVAAETVGVRGPSAESRAYVVALFRGLALAGT